MPEYDYDLLVIGSGPAGPRAAIPGAPDGQSAATRGRAGGGGGGWRDTAPSPAWGCAVPKRPLGTRTPCG